MGMPMELNTLIVTDGKEKRIRHNEFELVKEGYQLYPMQTPLEVKHSPDSEYRATGMIKKIVWEEHKTMIYYELIALHSTN